MHFLLRRSIKRLFLVVSCLSIIPISCTDPYSEYYFPTSEYLSILNIIKDMDYAAYKKLALCEVKRGASCIIKNPSNWGYGIIPGDLDSKGYPIISVHSFLHLGKQMQENTLKPLLSEYNKEKIIPDLTTSQRKTIAEIIDRLAPDLYNLLMSVDPNLKEHIVGYYSQLAGTSVHEKNGFPVFSTGQQFFDLSLKEQEAVMAHELSHYVLGHNQRHPETFGGITFDNAYSRIQEYEADRYSVLGFGVEIDDAIAAAEKSPDVFPESPELPSKKTFFRTHPFGVWRIAQFNSLRDEVDRRKKLNRPLKEIDWQNLADSYLEMETITTTLDDSTEPEDFATPMN